MLGLGTKSTIVFYAVVVYLLRQLDEKQIAMAYAIIAAGGTQLRVEPGRFYDINRLPVEADEKITIDDVLMVENGDDVTIGQPLVSGATVSGTVVSHLRGKKVIVYKMQPKKKTRKKRGHRQELTRVMIDSITVDGKTITAEDS